jgi:hypothetical protein
VVNEIEVGGYCAQPEFSEPGKEKKKRCKRYKGCFSKKKKRAEVITLYEEKEKSKFVIFR